jgi:hypothetical protein
MSETQSTPMLETELLSIEYWKAEVLQICKRGGVSMAEISKLPHSKGQQDLMLADRDNVILWIDLEENLIQAISQLAESEEITVRSCNVLIYAIDGCILRLPIAKPRRRYKTPHWMPVTLSLADPNSHHNKI